MMPMTSYSVRTYGDPVLKQPARDIEQVDGNLVRLVDDMVETMYDAVGAGLAAPQVGIQKRIFVYDVGDGPEVIINPTIVETSGEWYHDEGCLSVPGLRLGLTRPDQVHLRGFDLDGRELSIEADEFLGRVFQHEVDHLDGVLMMERLDPDQRKLALRVLRDRDLGLDTSAMEAKLVSAGQRPDRLIFQGGEGPSAVLWCSRKASESGTGSVVDEEIHPCVTAGRGELVVERGQWSSQALGENEVGGVIGAEAMTSAGCQERCHIGRRHIDTDRELSEQVEETSGLGLSDPCASLCDEQHVGDFELPHARHDGLVL